MVDRLLILRKLHELDRYLAELRKYEGIDPQELKNSLEKTWTIEHGLQLCIQILLDIGNHILAEKGIAVSDYAEVFDLLGAQGVIPEDFAQKIRGMAGFRNIVVHEYEEVDLEKVCVILRRHLDDFGAFAGFISKYIVPDAAKED